MRSVDSANETVIRAIVGSAVEAYAVGFQAPHEAEVDK
jgi:hypothetical protein